MNSPSFDRVPTEASRSVTLTNSMSIIPDSPSTIVDGVAPTLSSGP